MGPVPRLGRALGASLLALLFILPSGAWAAIDPVDPAWSILVDPDAAVVDPDSQAAEYTFIVRPGPDGFPGGAIPGQHCIFLIAIRPSDPAWRGMVDVTATAPGGKGARPAPTHGP